MASYFFGSNNVSLVLKEFNISEAVDLFSEGKMTQYLAKSFFLVFEML